jgi:uncharacterized membrane protein (UPF0127 family)
MSPRRFRGLRTEVVLGFEVPVATTPLSRLLGLALLPADRAGEGLLIPGCRSVHTLGMRFPLDLVFLDRTGRVIELRRGVRPGRLVRCAQAQSVLELVTQDPVRRRTPNVSRVSTRVT